MGIVQHLLRLARCGNLSVHEGNQPPAQACNERHVVFDDQHADAVLRRFPDDVGKDALVIEVASNGCTKKEDFAFYLERRLQAAESWFRRL